jgi:hypothetical protein
MAPTKKHPWKQGWRGPNYGNMPAYSYPMQTQQYSQFPTQFPSQPYPTQAPQQIVQPQQLQLPSNQPPRPTQLPMYHVPNPNNKVAHPIFGTELQPFPTYLVTPVGLQDIHL